MAWVGQIRSEFYGERLREHAAWQTGPTIRKHGAGIWRDLAAFSD